jgi:hypothetical protein
LPFKIVGDIVIPISWDFRILHEFTHLKQRCIVKEAGMSFISATSTNAVSTTTPSGFAGLARKMAEDDTVRGGEGMPSNPKERCGAMPDLLHNDKLWASEYETFALQVPFAGPGETITYAEAFAATRQLVDKVCREGTE